MSRLIDADKLNEDLSQTCLKSLGLNVDNIVRLQPTVEAVPLEPLSMWLASYASPPYSAIKAVYDPKQSNMTNQFEAWKYQLRDLLKSGLMDTEGEDARP